MNFNCFRLWSKSIEPNDNDLELNTIAHKFSKIFQPECNEQTEQLLRRSWTPYLGLFSSQQRRTGKLKKRKKYLSLLRKISLPSGGIQERKNSWAGKTKQTKSTTTQDFSGEASSKQNKKDWLASLSWDSSRAPTKWSATFPFGV